MKLKLSVEKNEAGKIIEVFFDQRHKLTTYEVLNALPSNAFVLTRGTAFQQKVWLELCNIPVGTTISYQEMADRVGRTKAQQAVG